MRPKLPKVNFLIILLLFSLLVSLPNCSKKLPALGELPSFELQDQTGQQVFPKNFAGKVLAANFVFTSCAGTCPLLTERMKKVQQFIEKAQKEGKESPYHILSFSVDPERDTPEVLQKYIKTYEVNPKIWSFLTGPYQDVEKVVVQGFKISMGKVDLKDMPKDKAEPVYDVIHGEKFILIDQEGRIRGYYDATEGGIYQLTQAMAKLAKK